MEYEFTDEQEAFRSELQSWLADNVPEWWEANDRSLPEDVDEQERRLREWQARLDDGSWAGIHWPAKYGGRDASLWEQTIYTQEFAYADPPPEINELGISLTGPTLMRLGTEAQKERFIPRILAGEEVWCLGYSEPGSGSDVASLSTRASVSGDELVVNGQKIWTSYAHFADWCLLMTRTDDSGTKHEGITAVMLDMNQAGIETNRIHQIDDNRNFDEVFFDDAVASLDWVVGDVDEGWEVMKTISTLEHDYTEIFEVERRLSELREYCETHTRSGDPLIADSEVRRRLAEFDTRVEAAKLLHYRNVTRQVEEGEMAGEGSLDFLVSKDLRTEFEAFAHRLLGPGATLWEDGHAGGRWVDDYLWSFGAWIAGGTGDIQRNIVGEQLLGLPKDPKSETSHVEAER